MTSEAMEPPARAVPPVPAAAHVTLWLLAPVVAMAAFMEVLDTSIANVSLRHIAGSLAASQDESTWVLTSYLVTNAIVLPISGWLSSVLGRKRFYTLCILGFGLSSLLCGIAPSLMVLILCRGIQGLVGGGLQPVSQAILADSFPPAKRGQAFAFYGMAVVFAPAIGPTLGGWITDNYSWRWIFLINVPVSIALFFLVQAMIEDPAHLKEERQRRRRAGFSVDYMGFGLLALGLGCLQFVLDKGQEDDWFGSDVIRVATAVAVVALVACVVWELRRKDPIVDLKLLKNRNFATANVLMLMLGFILLGSTTLIPQFVQNLLGYTATEAGMVISPGGFAIMLAMALVGRLVGKVDARWLILAGLASSAFALYHMTSFDTEVDYWTIATWRIVQAVGLGFLFIPITTIAYVGIPPEKNNNASALINLARNLGGSIGISFLTTLQARREQYHRSMMVEHISASAGAYRHMAAQLQERFAAAGAGGREAIARAQAEIAAMVDHQAQMLSYIDSFMILAAIFAALMPVVFFIRKGKAGGGPTAAH